MTSSPDPDRTIRLSESQTLTVHTSTPERLEMESRWTTSPKPPPLHWHPSQAERFEVLEGELTVVVGEAAPRVLGAGEVVDLPPRTAHQMWNAGPDPVMATWLVTPARRTEEMLRFIAGGTGGLRGARLLTTFRHEFRLGRPRG